MSREQEFERQLAEWLVDGPSTAPAEVVDRALEQTDGRRQWRGAGRLLMLPFVQRDRRSSVQRMARVSALAAVFAGVLLASVIVSVPFIGGTGSPPRMDGETPRAVLGTAVAETTSQAPGGSVVRSIALESEDPRIEGYARQVLDVLLDEGGGQRLSGTMRLENDWGAWEGPVDIVRYPTGEELEYASLAGSGAYEGYIYVHTIRHATAEAARSVEGAIWPDEPPAPPDPQLLP